MNLSRRDQYLLIFLVVILIGFGFFRLVYLPMNKEIKTITTNNQQLQLEKERLQAQVKQHPKKTEETEDKFAHLNKRLPTEDEMIPLLTMLDETTGKYGLPFASLDYKGAEKPDETGAQILVFTIGTKGKIAELFNFLDELEKAERLISVEDVSFNAVKAEAQETAEAVEPGPPAYYIAPPGIPEAKLQRIKFEVVEEAAEPPTQSERPVADSFMPGNFEMKMTIKAYYAATDESAPAPEANNESKPANDSGGEV
ncbi:MAG: type 4a pilus biogenesis protein PilO [Syntrophomonadaceae bacterium]|jgi:Tfp pilus assembly protein PilO|nr:type 4a pilus biogenesis protein PilO [Syntrophomonadaceae bacterium]NLX01436.1 type 4a pilus biogenesis protein PilO [Syntrophomonadaceae bacterium]